MIGESGFYNFRTSRGKQLEYLLSFPQRFSPEIAYPTLLALPPGEQTRELAQVYEPWFPFFQEQGWVICCPVVPSNKLFFQGAERYLPYFMDHLESQMYLAGGKFYLFGVSNGGISAFRAATLNPERFHSITVCPGWPKPADVNRLETILNLPVNFLVGDMDTRWRIKSEDFSRKILDMGGDAMLELIPGEGHMAFQTISAARLLQTFMRNVN